REAIVDGVPVGAVGSIVRIVLSSSAPNPAGTVVSGIDDPEIALEAVVHDFAGYRAVSLFVVNRRTKGALGDRSKDERRIYQPRLVVTTPQREAVFVAKDFRTDPLLTEDDGEATTNALLYRHAREVATGHSVAAEWISQSKTAAAPPPFSPSSCRRTKCRCSLRRANRPATPFLT